MQSTPDSSVAGAGRRWRLVLPSGNGGTRTVSAIERIRATLAQYPSLQVTSSHDSIAVAPPTPNGFTVRLAAKNGRFTVSFEGLHEQFRNEADALNCLTFGLSRGCRLRIDRRGDFAYRWTVEYLRGGHWVADRTARLRLYPFWRAVRTEYRRNDVIPTP